jgi:DNA-binding transcriptional MerR regulator
VKRTSQREFYSIGEVCEMLGIKPHVLRYWETQFEALNPPKNRAGNRVYRARDLQRIALIHRLVHEEKYTIEGARKRIEQEDAGGIQAEQRALERAVIHNLRNELEGLLGLLEEVPC